MCRTPATRRSNRNILSEILRQRQIRRPESPIPMAARSYAPDARAVRGGSDAAAERPVIDVPEGQDPIIHVWGVMVPGIGPAAAKFAQAVYDHSTLGLREFEAARLRSPRSTAACSARTGAPTGTA